MGKRKEPFLSPIKANTERKKKEEEPEKSAVHSYL